MDRLRRRIQRLAEQLDAKVLDQFGRYRNDPVGYARDILGVQWWAKQVEIANGLTKPPYRVLVKASHSVGKTHLTAGLVNWWYDTHDPGIVLTTAPKYQQVKDILWKEVRVQRRGRGGFPGPKVPRLESGPDHFAAGFTANTSTAAQGHHGRAMLVIFDEAVGVDSEQWDAAESMVAGVEYGWLAICNPTDTTSRFYQEEQSGRWTVVHISCLDHPNIAAELAEQPAPYPAAVRLQWLMERLAAWCTPVPIEDRRPGDIEFLGQVLRPGPLAEARLLGRWPSATSGVWSDVLWATVEAAGLEVPAGGQPEIGCDVARFGDDDTVIHVRWGPVSLHHEWRNGWSTTETAGRLKELCREWAHRANAAKPGHAPVKPDEILVKIDDDGVGGGVVDQADGYAFQPVSGANVARESDSYPNTRSELWFATVERAKEGRLDLSRLGAESLRRLRGQAMAPKYKLDTAGRRVVEAKDVTKGKIGRSPDDMDALNLAYYETGGDVPEWVTERPRDESAGHRIGLLGRVARETS